MGYLRVDCSEDNILMDDILGLGGAQRGIF